MKYIFLFNKEMEYNIKLTSNIKRRGEKIQQIYDRTNKTNRNKKFKMN